VSLSNHERPFDKLRTGPSTGSGRTVIKGVSRGFHHSWRMLQPCLERMLQATRFSSRWRPSAEGRPYNAVGFKGVPTNFPPPPPGLLPLHFL
ncbi:MAG: hypothetical protein WBC55_03425, partial [Dehalococcoidia bacterium]